MDFKSRLKWTVLPAGADFSAGNLTLHLSVLVSPELLAATAQDTGKGVPLRGSPFLNWPQTLAGLNFVLQFGAGPGRVVYPRNRGDQGVWQRFFGDVTAILRDPAGAPTQPTTPGPISDVRHFSYESAHEELRTFYRLAAEYSLRSRRPVALRPLTERLAGQAHTQQLLPSISHLRETFGSLAPTSRSTFVREESVFVRNEPDTQGLRGAVAFYDRSSSSSHARRSLRSTARPLATTAPEGTDMEFHQWVSSVAQYPWLQRQLGLLLDFDVELPSTGIPAGDGHISISTNPAFSGPTLRTHYHLRTSPPVFEASWRDEASAPYGCLQLGRAPYSLSQVSVDGGAIRAQGFGRELHAMPDNETAVPPALRTGPLSVTKEALVQELASKVARAQQQHDSAQRSGSVDLNAEDLVKGIRVDVFDHDAWFPLCERECTLSLTGEETKTDSKFVDEGWISLALTTQEDENFLHEAIFSWAGWSLVAGRPGKTMGQNGEAVDWTPPVQGKPRVVVKRGPTKYPAYRLDREYRFRARTVDLAGRSNALPSSANLDSRIVTATRRGQRFEPVGAPFVVPLSDFKTSPGESARILVIRTGDDPYQEASTYRHVAPPSIDYVLAELHSLFDEKGAPSKSKYREVVRASRPPAFASDIYWFDPSPDLRLDYTKDPLSGGAVFFGLPNTNSPFFVREDKPGPFRLKLVDGNAAPSWEKSDRLLTVAIPVAHAATVQVASILRPNSLRALGMWEWMQGIENSPSEEDALNGLLWSLTPSRELTLIHAIQRPLKEPVPLLKIVDSPPRRMNDSFVALKGSIELDVLSTGEMEVTGEYTEWVDDPDAKHPVQQTSSSHALAITPVPETCKSPAQVGNSDPDSIASLVRQNFPDTHYRNVSYTAVATSRFKQQFAYTKQQLGAQPDLITKRTYDGSDKKRNEKYQDKDRRAWVRVPSTARPNAPEVFCILPLYGWCDPVREKKGTVRRTMRGGGLRIYLKRGWYSSGDGEQLAIILWPAAKDWFVNGHDELPVDVRPFVSQWGMDPVWASTELQTLLEPEHFLNSAGVSDVTHTLPEFEAAGDAVYPEDRKVSAVLFNPSLDTGRGLWYCDIEMDERLTYSPFVRLALARFQAYSIEERNDQNGLIRDVHLSHAVLADFVQLPSGRFVTIVENRNKKQLSVTVNGLSYHAVAAGESHPSMEASLEVRNYHVPLDWSPVKGKKVVLTPSCSPTDSTTIWQGVLSLDDHIRHGKKRLVLRETVSLPNVDGSSGKRLVYADVLEL